VDGPVTNIRRNRRSAHPHRQCHIEIDLVAVRIAPMILTPRAFLCEAGEVRTSDVMVMADLGAEMGLQETRASVSNKISRGRLPAAFSVAALKAIGVQQMRLEDV
jgi:hypothetical protein